MSDLQPRAAAAVPARRRPWRPTTITIMALALLIGLNEAQRIAAQWQAHQERQAQLYEARAAGLKLDKVVQQNDLQLRLLMQHSTDLDRLQASATERAILSRPNHP